MKIWIDIEDSSGTKYGEGPIVNVSQWQQIRRLDQAGTFQFSMVATDPRASLVQTKRVARCYGIIDDAVTELGAGIIDSISTRTQVNGATILDVSGGDLMRELALRSVQFLRLVDRTTANPDYAKHYDASGTSYTDLANAIDGNAGSLSSVNYDFGDYIYIGDGAVFTLIDFDLDSNVNLQQALMLMEYYNGSEWKEVAVVNDGTMLVSTPMRIDGTIEFPEPEDWDTGTVDGDSAYWVRIAFDRDLNTIDFAEIEVATEDDCTTPVATILAYHPSWSLDTTNGYSDASYQPFTYFKGESVLAALNHLVDLSGEHFIYSPDGGRKIAWLQDVMGKSGIRLVSSPDPVEAENESDIGQIVSLTEIEDSYDYFSRIYPFADRTDWGPGELISLKQANWAPPSGYTILNYTGSDDLGYIKHDDSDSALRADRFMYISGVTWAGARWAKLVKAGNKLADLAYQQLRKAVTTYKAYSIEVAGLNALLYPGYTVRVVYTEWRNGEQIIDIDDDLKILEVSHRIDSRGVSTTSLQAATFDRWWKTDSEMSFRITGPVSEYMG